MTSKKTLWNDTTRYETALDQAVIFIAKLSNLVISAKKEADSAVSGKNKTVRDNSAVAVQKKVSQLITETEHWNHVLETMIAGKDVHVQENCKGSKLDIVAGSEYELGQYLIDQSDRTADKYIAKITGETTDEQK
tara:strand:+ start:77 stop:481 length:405 start_codon:yes stop_codon:yes gene_type:complete